MSSNSESGIVRTVLGDLPSDKLGHTQCHEHIFLEKGPSYLSNPALCMDDYGRSLSELREYFEAGGRTIVDAQPVFCGRNAEVLRKLSAESGVGIVAVTGFHKKLFIEPNAPVLTASEDELKDLYVSEIRDGMLTLSGERSSAKAGIVKVAYEKDGLEDRQYGRMFAAAAETSKITGAPVMVHTEKDTDIFVLIRYFEDRRVPADRIIICHLDRTRYDVQYHLELLKTGCFLCYDSINRLKYLSEEEELALIATVRDAGYVKQIVLSLDTTNQRLRAYGAKDMGLDFILKSYIPLLSERGFTDEEIRYMCQTNAHKALSFK